MPKTNDPELDLRRLSKTCAHALRHAPHLYELELDDQGWASTEALLVGLRAHRRAWRALALEELARMVDSCIEGPLRALRGPRAHPRPVRPLDHVSPGQDPRPGRSTTGRTQRRPR